MTLLSQIDLARLETLRALGIDVETIVFPTSPTPGGTPKLEGGDSSGLSDEEWALLVPHLPADPAQAAVMGNRPFIDAVLWVLARGKAWTQIPGEAGEAVRRRFARWAHAGRWTHLYEGARGQGLSARREAQLAGISKRALGLQERICARRAVC